MTAVAGLARLPKRVISEVSEGTCAQGGYVATKYRRPSSSCELGWCRRHWRSACGALRVGLADFSGALVASSEEEETTSVL